MFAPDGLDATLLVNQLESALMYVQNRSKKILKMLGESIWGGSIVDIGWGTDFVWGIGP